VKEILLRVLIFTISLYLLFKIPGLFDIHAANEQSVDLSRLQCSRSIDSCELLFLGGSYSYSSINPKYFDSLGIKSFNLGISGSGVYFTEILLNDFYKNSKFKPSYLLFDISLFAFSDRSDDFYAYPLHRYLQEIMSHEGLLLKYPDLINIFPKLIVKSCQKGIASFYKKTLIKADSVCFYKGFYPNYSIRSSLVMQNDSMLLRDFYKARFDNNKLKVFLDMTLRYSKMGCKIYWFEAQTDKLKNYFSTDYLNNYQIALKQLKNSDYLHEIELDITFNNEDYRNTDHLNYFGASKFSSKLADYFATKILTKAESAK
jgi:hypothetical protein